jgi:hypothetical protein
VACADDQVISFEIKLLDGRGKTGEIRSVVGRCLWEMLNERGVDIHSLNNVGQLILDIKEGKEVGLRIELAEDLKAFLTSSHACEPIMD